MRGFVQLEEGVPESWAYVYKKVVVPGKCQVAYCRRDSGGSDRRRICMVCATRMWRLRHPVKYMWVNMKNRARQRNIPFEISVEDLTEVLGERVTGKFAEAPSIDRIDATLGYVPGNLQVLTLRENGKKGVYERDGIICPF